MIIIICKFDFQKKIVFGSFQADPFSMGIIYTKKKGIVSKCFPNESPMDTMMTLI